MHERVLERLNEAGLDVRPAEAGKLADYLLLLERWNRVHNLTGIREFDEMIERHLAESLALRGLLRGQRIADVGSGAGLPGIPLAIVEPKKSFTLIESRAKRASFLSHVQGALALSNVSVEHGRVEDLRGQAPFDTVLARAVAPLPELVGLTAHLLGEESVLLVPTKADVDVTTSGVDDRFEIRRIERDERELLKGALIAIERRVG
ncbi:MAG: 16S rRNA (guanine(527)-N(7))-methyltransferase RsmG [Gammaproteobacteria bacterium]|nr:16S rRNA (guanine(527)-N(7))-methyltransferase RsmG [Gammaproteobacteria bacterium]MDH3507308.1 16S rRNA (guanine(527)-N(7))-methyltransferase RsmG [Gammaproteobacteria bacterium]